MRVAPALKAKKSTKTASARLTLNVPQPTKRHILPVVADKNITFLWHTFTRFEPAADTYAAATKLHRHHPCYTPPIVLDCRMKPGYPDELVTDEATARKVSNRWKEYFPEGNVEGEEDPLGYTGFSLLD